MPGIAVPMTEPSLGNSVIWDPIPLRSRSATVSSVKQEVLERTGCWWIMKLRIMKLKCVLVDVVARISKQKRRRWVNIPSSVLYV